jgi:hypothetical protein
MLETADVCDNSKTIAPDLSNGGFKDGVDSGGVQVEDVGERIRKWAGNI